MSHVWVGDSYNDDIRAMWAGANFSPGNYVGLTFMYIRLFRERAFTLPWSEDWIWQIPVASQQIMTVVLDAFRR